MNIFKMIKQFVQNSLNGTKLLESPQYNSKLKAKEKKQFKDMFSVNLNTLLKSEEYVGTEAISNILILLGAEQKLANNPIMLSQIEHVFLKNIPEIFAKKITNRNVLYKKDIKECVNELKKAFQSCQTTENKKRQENFRVNKDGTIVQKGVIGDNKLGERKYSISEEELIIQQNYTEKFYNKAPLFHQKKYTYNNMNILMERSHIYVDIQVDGKLSPKLIKDTRKRDIDYPFIVYHSYQDQNENMYEDIYSIAYASNICSMEDDFLSLGQKIVSKEEIDIYYQNHKKNILDLLAACGNDNCEDEKGRKASDMYKYAITSKRIGVDCKNTYKRNYGKEL